MGGLCKALVELAGKPMLYYSLEVFQDSPLVDGVVVVVPVDRLSDFEGDFTRRWRCEKVLAWVAGGERRQDSVTAALRSVPEDVAWIAVHDAARPFFTERLLERLLKTVRKTGAVVPGIAPADTIKEVDDSGFIRRTPAREMLRAVQTPQVFAAKVLRRAYHEAEGSEMESTDDASLVERIGHDVAVVMGNSENIKITRPIDLELAKQILKNRKIQAPSHK